MERSSKNTIFYGSGYLLLATYMTMAYYSPDVDSTIYEVIQFFSLSLSLLLITIITVINYIRGGKIFVSYEQMDKRELDICFDKFNRNNDNGIEWYTVPGHYWLEIRITPLKKKRDKPLFMQENFPVAAQRFLETSQLGNVPESIYNPSRMQSQPPMHPMYNNLMNSSSKPAIFSNPNIPSANDDT